MVRAAGVPIVLDAEWSRYAGETHDIVIPARRLLHKSSALLSLHQPEPRTVAQVVVTKLEMKHGSEARLCHENIGMSLKEDFQVVPLKMEYHMVLKLLLYGRTATT